MRERRVLRGLPLVAVAVAGVLIGHWVAYRLAVPHTQARDAILAETGHSYWLWAVKVAVATGLAGLGALFVRHARAPVRAEGRSIDIYTWLLSRLAIIQAASFLAMEMAERIATGAPLSGVLSHDVLVLGLATQFLVACLGALGLLWLSRAVAEVVVALLSHPVQRAAGPRRPFSLLVRPPIQVMVGAGGVRGPPSS